MVTALRVRAFVAFLALTALIASPLFAGVPRIIVAEDFGKVGT